MGIRNPALPDSFLFWGVRFCMGSLLQKGRDCYNRKKVTIQDRFMPNRINRMKTYRMQEQASSAKLIFIGLRLVSVKVLNRCEKGEKSEKTVWARS